MPTDVMSMQPKEVFSLQDHVTELLKHLESKFHHVIKQIGHKLDRQKEFYNQKIHRNLYAEGELLWLYSPFQGHLKLYISNRMSHTGFRLPIQDSNGNIPSWSLKILPT